MIQAVIINLAFTLPVLALLRGVLGRRIEALMMRRSPQSGNGSRLAPRPGRQVATTTRPRLVELTRACPAAGGKHVRHAIGRQGLSLFRRWSFYDAISVLSVLMLGDLVTNGKLEMSPLLIGAWLLVIGLRHLVYAGNYVDRAIRGARQRGWFRRWVTVTLEEMFRVVAHPQYSWCAMVLFLLAVHAERAFSMIWLGLMLLVMMTLRVLLYRQAQVGANYKLLLLRVFGNDENSLLSFGALRHYWQHIGSTFTVVDRSYLRYKYRGHSEQQVAVIVLSCWSIALLFGTPAFNEWFYIGPSLGVLIVVTYLLATLVMYIMAPRSFATSSSQIQQRVDRFLRQPRRWDLTFKNLDMYCYDNTWQDAVAELVPRADALLMDLRGFSEQNKGCEKEISFLTDSVPLDHIVFLVDDANDLRLIEKVIFEVWEELDAESPNLTLRDPVVNLYNIGDQTVTDVRGLVDTLATCVAPKSAATSAPPSGGMWRPNPQQSHRSTEPVNI